MILHSARSKHLRAKRLATANNSLAMAEILGIAPPTPAESSASASPRVSPPPSTRPGISSGMLVGTVAPPLEVSPPNGETFPAVPPRKEVTSGMAGFPSFAKASTSSLKATFDDTASTPRTGLGGAGIGAGGAGSSSGLASMFAKASTSSLAATFQPAAEKKEANGDDVEMAGEQESEKSRLKREKREKKEAKRAKKEAKAAPIESAEALPGFAPAAAGTSLPSTVGEVPLVDGNGDSDEAKRKREKQEKKERKEAKRLKKEKKSSA